MAEDSFNAAVYLYQNKNKDKYVYVQIGKEPVPGVWSLYLAEHYISYILTFKPIHWMPYFRYR